MKFLGHFAIPEGILPLPDRVERIQNYPKPSTVKQLRVYLGLLSYCHCFVKDLSRHLAPQYGQLKSSKTTKRDLINWTLNTKIAYENSKKLLADTIGFSESHCAPAYLLTYMFKYRIQEVNMNDYYKFTLFTLDFFYILFSIVVFVCNLIIV